MAPVMYGPAMTLRVRHWHGKSVSVSDKQLVKKHQGKNVCQMIIVNSQRCLIVFRLNEAMPFQG